MALLGALVIVLSAIAACSPLKADITETAMTQSIPTKRGALNPPIEAEILRAPAAPITRSMFASWLSSADAKTDAFWAWDEILLLKMGPKPLVLLVGPVVQRAQSHGDHEELCPISARNTLFLW